MQLIGKISGIHGLKGEITFYHQLKKNTRFATWDCILIEINPKSYIPFFIASIKSISSDECICKFEEINTRDEAKKIVNKTIYSSINYHVEIKDDTGLQQYLGYQIYDGENFIGEIIDAVETKMNNMFVINYNDREVLLPSQKELILSIDKTNKKMVMNIPEGLLDL